MSGSPSVRSIITKCLGGMWILDGLLQLQPQMFGSAFVSSVLVPNLSNQPHFLHALVVLGIYLWSLHPALANTMAALIQIIIGVLLFFPSSSKPLRIGLSISILWGFLVWVCGEGMGSLFTGTASLYSGAPGAVLLYVFLAVLLLSEKAKLSWFPKIVGWLLVLGSLLQLQSGFWTAGGIRGNLTASTMESVHALNSIPLYISNMLSMNPVAGNLFLVFVPLVIGLLLLIKPNRITATIAVIFFFLMWWWGQDFGMLSTLFAGTSTDPNAAPLLALFVIPLFFDLKDNHQLTSIAAGGLLVSQNSH
jgi:hypothetical protein